MNRQRGMSTLALVLLLLVLGSLLLSGLNQQLSNHTWRVNQESQAIRRMANIHSAMAWGQHQSWSVSAGLQCLQHDAHDWRACVRVFSDRTAILIAGNHQAQLWRLGQVSAQRIHFSSRGWSDFCPLKEPALCQFP